METRLLLIFITLTCVAVNESVFAFTVSSRLIHRFSDEFKAVRVSRGGNASEWPQRRSFLYYKMLYSSDLQRQKMKLGPKYQLLFPFEGSKTMSLGNDFGWCSLVFGASIMQDRDLNEYDPSSSSTSKHVPCNHQLCASVSSCKSPQERCSYTVNYYTENTSSSGFLVEDILHFSSGSGDALNTSVEAPVLMGCGMKQSGGYLEGVAPDGLMGLGLREISVPNYLAKTGLVKNSLSLCFDEDNSGRIFFGDQGPAVQQSTPFLPLEGEITTYIVGVETSCIWNSCLKQSSFKALIDSGSSFTYLPNGVYEKITEEFDRHVNATRSNLNEDWEYCYETSSSKLPKVPTVTFSFPMNNSFVVHNPVFIIQGKQGVAGFCLAIQPADTDIGIIGQNFMTGYRLVFDRENLKLGWSQSKCQDLSHGERMPLTPKGTPSNPLPTNEQQRAPTHAVAPAIAGRTPSTPSSASSHFIPSLGWLLRLLPFLLLQLCLRFI